VTDSPPPATSKRTWQLSAGALVAIIVGVLVAISVSSGNDVRGDGTNLAGVDGATALFSGIAQNGLVIGRPTAKVTIVEYLDLQCPRCAEAASSVVPMVMTYFVRNGRAKLELRPTDLIAGPDSRLGGRALYAAGEQGHAGEFAEVMFANQGDERSGWLNDAIIQRVSEVLNLDTAALNATRASAAADHVVDTVNETMVSNGYNGTPTFIVKGPNGQHEVQNVTNMAEFAQAINAVR